MAKVVYGAVFVLFFFLNGCTLVNISLLPREQPLEEQVVEGEGQPKILIMDVTGFISEEKPRGGPLAPAGASMPDRIRESLKKAEKDKDIKGLIVRINSPGGLVTTSDIIYHEIKSYRERTKVPVYAALMDVGTSGAYYIATAADRIYANPTTITGSIGVMAMKFGVNGLLTKIGVEDTVVKSGPEKDVFSPFRTTTPEELEIIQGIIDDMYGRFVEVVRQGRGDRLAADRLELITDGRPFSAAMAKELGLIDGMRHLPEVVEEMKQALGVEQARVVMYAKPGSYKGSIYSTQAPDVTARSALREGEHILRRLPGVNFLYLWWGRPGEAAWGQ
ncbi:MAG: signal peptide peptidase SppA [Nitrospirota bacterium]|jgi:protease-4